ncbi:28S rRNA (cytosine-C(5))-methyltransferase [Frankliniella fusca]|uniref:28S rRNA (Cytosine-C(5))-methyltransferase n=1 Tax=Frankliniella fusca TaxID=407009 RepID=A0AAE1LUB9_9NEOP|nr:28S rRNA (cytosine-C(5))-methyltransferase [Frankliniella fusca]
MLTRPMPTSRASRPRFVRINTLKSTEDEVINSFIQEGWHIQTLGNKRIPEDEKYNNFLQIVSSLSEREFIKDIHIPNLLIFPGNMEFYNLELYHTGSILLQDKASCMSAFLLDAPQGSTVLDMCAAPGMKTTHIAATLGNTGTVYAIEKHPGRFDSLCQIVQQAGASCVKPILGSSLDFTHKELPDVEYIIVDPTCSGSGMTNRKELFSDTDDVSKARLEKLAGFQCAILRHAMQNFPKVKRIVYSTCSLCPEENEAVVDEVLKSIPPNFKAVVPSNGTQWMKRGLNSYDHGSFGLYARPDEDMTNGFFVAVFERTENEYVLKEPIDLTQANVVKQDLNKKKKRKDKKITDVENASAPEAINPAFERMKRAMGNFNAAVENGSISELNGDTEKVSESSKKAKKRKLIEEQEKCDQLNGDFISLGESSSKKKKKRHSAIDNDTNASENIDEGILKKKKKEKKKKKSKEVSEIDEQQEEANSYCILDSTKSSPLEEISKKKKKKKKINSE